MYILVSYDVSTTSPEGKRRLRQIAKSCLNRGQRVQNSIFECKVDPAQYAHFKKELLDIINDKEDSLRFYLLGKNWKKRIEHFGSKEIYDIEGPLIL